MRMECIEDRMRKQQTKDFIFFISSISYEKKKAPLCSKTADGTLHCRF